MRTNDPLKNPFLNSVVVFFGGGGAPKAPKPPKQEKVVIPETPAITMPEIPPAEPIPPAPTQSKLEVQTAQDEQRRAALKRKGARSTLIAGETGGFAQGGEVKKNLLG